MNYRNRSVTVLVGLLLLGAGCSSDDSPANDGSSSAPTQSTSGEGESSSGDDGGATSGEGETSGDGETSDAAFAQAMDAPVFLELEEEITIIPPLGRQLRVRAIDLGDSMSRTVRPVAVGTEQPGPVQRDELLAMGRYLGTLEAQLGKTGGDEAKLYVQRIAEPILEATPNGDSSSVMNSIDEGTAQEGAAALFSHIAGNIELEEPLYDELLASHTAGLVEG